MCLGLWILIRIHFPSGSRRVHLSTKNRKNARKLPITASLLSFLKVNLHKFHCFLFGAICNVFYQGWEFAHLISEWIACFLSKNELMSDSLKKMSNSSQSLIWFERNERMSKWATSKWATSKWANYQPCFLPLKKTLNDFFLFKFGLAGPGHAFRKTAGSGSAFRKTAGSGSAFRKTAGSRSA